MCIFHVTENGKIIDERLDINEAIDICINKVGDSSKEIRRTILDAMVFVLEADEYSLSIGKDVFKIIRGFSDVDCCWI